MIAVQQTHDNRTRVMWLGVALALIAALGYVMIAFGILATGDLQKSEEPAGIVYVAAGCYALGGLLILLRTRWLWIVGAVMNALVMLFFLMVYSNRPAVLLSPGGLVTKAAQVLLEIGLIYLIFTAGRRSRRW